MAEALQHHTRAAGLLVVEQRIPLARCEVGGDIYWTPPGGSFEPECDGLTKDTVRHELFEETGPRVDISPLAYVRESAEPAVRRFRMELFYHIDTWHGEPTLASLKDLGGNELDIRKVGWIARDGLSGLLSFYPAELAGDVWSRLDALTPSIRHLGLRHQTLTVLGRWWDSRGPPPALRL